MSEKEKIAGEKIAHSIYKKHWKKLLLSINSKNDASSHEGAVHVRLWFS